MRLFAVRESAHHHGFLHRDAMRRHRQRGPLQLPNPSSAVKDRGLLRVSLVSLGLAVIFLTVHTFLGVSAALATLLPAFLILVYESSRCTEVRDVLGRIDWQIFFFGGLFILVAGFAKTGLLVQLVGWMVQESGGNLALAVTLVLWTTAPGQPDRRQRTAGHGLHPRDRSNVKHFRSLNCTVSLGVGCGTGIGGMATSIGTASNMVALNILNKEKKRLSFSRLAKRSVPLTIIDLLIANAILLIRL